MAKSQESEPESESVRSPQWDLEVATAPPQLRKLGSGSESDSESESPYVMATRQKSESESVRSPALESDSE